MELPVRLGDRSRCGRIGEHVLGLGEIDDGELRDRLTEQLDRSVASSRTRPAKPPAWPDTSGPAA